MAWADCFNDKFWVYVWATIIVGMAIVAGLPNAGDIANIVIGGMFGSAIGGK